MEAPAFFLFSPVAAEEAELFLGAMAGGECEREVVRRRKDRAAAGARKKMKQKEARGKWQGKTIRSGETRTYGKR